MMLARWIRTTKILLSTFCIPAKFFPMKNSSSIGKNRLFLPPLFHRRYCFATFYLHTQSQQTAFNKIPSKSLFLLCLLWKGILSFCKTITLKFFLGITDFTVKNFLRTFVHVIFQQCWKDGAAVKCSYVSNTVEKLPLVN